MRYINLRYLLTYLLRVGVMVQQYGMASNSECLPVNNVFGASRGFSTTVELIIIIIIIIIIINESAVEFLHNLGHRIASISSDDKEGQ